MHHNYDGRPTRFVRTASSNVARIESFPRVRYRPSTHSHQGGATLQPSPRHHNRPSSNNAPARPLPLDAWSHRVFQFCVESCLSHVVGGDPLTTHSPIHPFPQTHTNTTLYSYTTSTTKNNFNQGSACWHSLILAFVRTLCISCRLYHRYKGRRSATSSPVLQTTAGLDSLDFSVDRLQGIDGTKGDRDTSLDRGWDIGILGIDTNQRCIELPGFGLHRVSYCRHCHACSEFNHCNLGCVSNERERFNIH